MRGQVGSGVDGGRRMPPAEHASSVVTVPLTSRAARMRTATTQPVLVLLLAVALGLLTVAVTVGWWPVSLDHAVAAAVPGKHATGLASVLLGLASAVTTLATPQGTVLLTLAMAAWLAHREGNLDALRVVAGPLVVLAVSVLAGKALLHRPGPPGSHLHHLFGYYPSGHTTTAVVCTGLLTRLAATRLPAQRDLLRAGAALWTLLVGASLVVHRYHWLSDVVAGLLLGSLIVHATRPALREATACTSDRVGNTILGSPST